MKPLVSVVIPTYNRSQVVGQAVQSVLEQTYDNLEVIVVDDGSTDGTQDKMAALADKEKRIRFLQHDVHKGSQAARNTGIKTAKGEWIAFLDSDDRWVRDSLKMRLDLAYKEKVKVVHSECYLILGNDKKMIYGIPCIAGKVYRKLLAKPGPMFQGLLVKKEALERINFLDERIVAWQEWDTSIRLAKHYNFGFVTQPTFIYDCRGKDMISKDRLRDVLGYEQVFRKHFLFVLFYAGPGALVKHYQTCASKYKKVGKGFAAQRY